MQSPSSFISRAAATLGRWLHREPAPGRWIEGAAFSWRGWITFRPWTWPRRRYSVYLPRGHSRWKRAPLIVLIHGCKQTAEEFARSTRIAGLADDEGALVLMPDQTDGANPYRCWNWFDRRTSAGDGEAAIIARMIAKVRRRYRANGDRVLVAGISAGAAMAAVLGVHHREVVRGVFTHAGIASGAAASPYTAVTVMRRGPETDVADIAREAAIASSVEAVVPLCAVHGLADDVVTPRHACALVRQFLAANGVDVPPGAATTMPPADTDVRDMSTLPYVVREREWTRDGRPLARLVEIETLGHAWPGGDGELPFSEARAPDGTEMLRRWLTEALPTRAV